MHCAIRFLTRIEISDSRSQRLLPQLCRPILDQAERGGCLFGDVGVYQEALPVGEDVVRVVEGKLQREQDLPAGLGNADTYTSTLPDTSH